MVKKLTFLIFIFSILVAPVISFSQIETGAIKGRIVDSTQNPLVNATLVLKIAKKTSTANINGFFIFEKIGELKDTLIISATGFENKFVAINLSIGQRLDLGTIKLKTSIIQLQSVEIKGRTSNSYKSDYSFYGNKTETPLIDIPQSISTVTKEVLKDKMVFNLKDAVQDVPGLNQYSGYDEYALRGFRADNAHDINGLRSYNTTYTSSMLVNIERIEVIKGPTATLYGNCDPGGTINMVTKKPLEKVSAEVDVYAGSWNHFRIQGDITGPLNTSKTLLYRFNAGFDSTKSFRNQFFAKSYQLAPSLSFIPNDKFRINFDFSYAHINAIVDRGQPGLQDNNNLNATPISLSLTQPGDYLHQTTFTSILALSYKISNNLTFSSSYLNYDTRQQAADHGINDYITPDSVSLYYTKWNYHTITNTLTNYLTYKFKPGKVNDQLLLGYDYIKTKVELNQQYYESPDDFEDGSGIVGTFSLLHPNYTAPQVKDYEISDFDSDASAVDATVYKTQGLYLQNQLSYKRWKILLSVREEFYRGANSIVMKENVFLPRLGVVYSLKPNLNLYVTYNKGFDPFEASTSLQLFNAPFKPITSELLESGVKGDFFGHKLNATLTFYQLTLHNVAVNANDISNPDLFIQQGEEQSRGIEAEITGNILPNLTVSLSYSYCNAKIKSSFVPAQVGTRVENAPLNTSSSWVKYTFNKGLLKGFGIVAGTSQESARNTLDPQIVLPGYLIVKGGVNYNRDHFTIAVIGNNLGNATYWTGAYNNVYKWPGQPRNFMLNIMYRF